MIFRRASKICWGLGNLQPCEGRRLFWDVRRLLRPFVRKCCDGSARSSTQGGAAATEWSRRDMAFFGGLALCRAVLPGATSSPSGEIRLESAWSGALVTRSSHDPSGFGASMISVLDDLDAVDPDVLDA
jgi:CubicO group peptidase (beta-lactamase class C family)